MTDTQQTSDDAPANPTREEARANRRADRLARQITAFATAHGGSAEATVEYIGARGSRIVLVGGDGAWGDLVAPTPAVAQDAVTRAGVTVHEDFEGEFAARIRTGRYEWTRMAGFQMGGPANT
ncbi:hypothetical protein [Actinacidiphila acidipaludis]|uniref:Uncharacterized protein n=1 Tax=Actinacidiphila acidipaludis TaxID=2873382 RepID=A0ABS7QHC5_9ACTN|nr:hypothetical protein [Streptomyces acidipaludis]MBY8882079.1 hypothetical protein [Streptomyces acidipaludis]